MFSLPGTVRGPTRDDLICLYICSDEHMSLTSPWNGVTGEKPIYMNQSNQNCRVYHQQRKEIFSVCDKAFE